MSDSKANSKELVSTTVRLRPDWLKAIKAVRKPGEATHAMILRAIKNEILRRDETVKLSKSPGSGGARKGAGRPRKKTENG